MLGRHVEVLSGIAADHAACKRGTDRDEDLLAWLEPSVLPRLLVVAISVQEKEMPLALVSEVHITNNQAGPAVVVVAI